MYTIDDLNVRLLSELKEIAEIPICVGFGISKPEHVLPLLDSGADGVIVGSAIVDLIAQNLDDENEMFRQIEEFAKLLKQETQPSSRGLGASN